MPFKIKDKTGIHYGRLIVIKLAYQDWNGRSYWICKCNCGKEITVRGNSLQSGHTKSCGCLNREITSKMMMGKNNPRYTNGKTTKIIRKLKENCREKDNNICQECGVTQEEYKRKHNRILDVHHIDGDNTNNAEENMITLCLGCHNKVEPRIEKGGK